MTERVSGSGRQKYGLSDNDLSSLAVDVSAVEGKSQMVTVVPSLARHS